MTEASGAILVAVSSPWASEKFIESIGDLASRYEAEVITVHVSQSEQEDDSEVDARERGDQIIGLLSTGLGERGVACEGVRVVSDDVARAVLNVADERQVRMIVMGVTQRKGFFSRFKRDIPHRILQNASVPVLLLPANWRGTL